MTAPDGALAKLMALDADMAKAVAEIGPPPDRSETPGFGTLARVIIGQQISTKAAAAVWARMRDAQFDHAAIAAAATIEELRDAGLSQRKAEYVKGLAEAVEDGSLDFNALPHMPGEDVTKKLVAIRGIGEWTADNYRLFVLADMDAWPFNDLALQEGMKILKSLNTRPDGATMKKMGDPWAPYRGAGALMLWHIYAHHRHAGSIADIAT
ncbi:MAG: DNA-3-methyladenine glycosylase 2 family protein [Alphaproteobacteria bacterium]|nr:DNA-3-methyladenine glycosylase 2 family protein [Alphaproteobacteria bacterium]